MQFIRSYIAHIRFERLISLIEWVLLCAALVAYVYFLVASIVHVVFREELLVAIDRTEARIAELEEAYFVQVAGVTEEALSDVGLVEVQPTAYVDTTADGRLSRADR